MRRALHSLLQTVVKYFAKGLITGKQMQVSNLVLHYEIDQFLGFLFQREIAYEPLLQQKVSNYISDDSLIFDVGSNIGQYALWFSYLAPRGKVICFEPDHKNFSFLSFNILSNRLDNVELCNCGLGDSISEQTFYRDTATGGSPASDYQRNS
ncbi:MAG: FkbM family methyltransferase, partial [Gammaproteobacteria bacterium]|nr:FkbM family methyltransferase [Gammaproteobacteria bacterium]